MYVVIATRADSSSEVPCTPKLGGKPCYFLSHTQHTTKPHVEVICGGENMDGPGEIFVSRDWGHSPHTLKGEKDPILAGYVFRPLRF